MLSHTEENYIKAIYHLSNHGDNEVSTNAISEVLNTKPATVSDMLKKLAKKEVIDYVKYQGVTITDSGKTFALKVIRKHRLWEVFLVSKLKFKWDEVHEVAEQLEHIQSPLLTRRLDEFLGFPKYDPHGDAIPDEYGVIAKSDKKPLNMLASGASGNVAGVKDTSPVFLKYLDKLGITINSRIEVVECVEYDGSLEIILNKGKQLIISSEAAKNIFVEETHPA